MAGWSMVADDGCVLDCAKTPRTRCELNGFCIDLKPPAKESGLKISQDNKLRRCFDSFLKSFLEEIYAIDSGFWPLPPMLGDGQCVDLLKLFLVVRENGGYEAISENGLWDLVAKDSGLGLNLASSVKLVYIKYLDALNRWLERLVDNKDSRSKLSGSELNVGGVLMESGTEFKGFLSEILDSKNLESKSELNVSAEVESNGGEKCVVDDEESMHIDSLKSGVDFVESEKLRNALVENAMMDDSSSNVDKTPNDENLQLDLTKSDNEDEEKSVVAEVDVVKESDVVLDSSAVEEHISRLKRKRESMCRMLNWVAGIARNPCDPIVVSLPERSKWKSYGNDEYWKQVLWVRQALFSKIHASSSAEQSFWQKSLKMHPCMYDEHVGSTYNLRERLRCSKKLLPGQSSSQAQACSPSSSGATQSDLDSCTEGTHDGDSSTEHSVLSHSAEKKIPLGPNFQAEVPEWNGVISESDSKWVGTRIWPLENLKQKFIIEREPIGKGRQDLCGCQVPKSIECVKFHTDERKTRLMRELGMAFYDWRFHKMGEGVNRVWTPEEEKEFKAIVRLNPPSLGRSFWDEISKSFRNKRREDLVSYYYNVFLLQRRAYQNRFTPNNIDSDDDDESECGLVTNGSGHETVKSSGSLLSAAKKLKTKSK